MKKILLFSLFLMIIVGFLFIVGGLLGIGFTYTNVTRENIITPDDSSIPGALVRGPLTLKAQADIIRVHTLRMTEGKIFSEMPRQIPKLDVEGKPILDKNNKPVTTANIARDIWITATTLTTALNLSILAYAFFTFLLLLGLFFVWIGVIFYIFLSKRKNFRFKL
jgi:hypothetical protein